MLTSAPSAPTAVAICLLAQICGSIAFLFGSRAASRSGEEPDAADSLAARFLTVPARVRLEPDSLKIIMPMDRIDLALRQAGLDRDPGWIPWLKRTVHLEFLNTTEEDLL